MARTKRQHPLQHVLEVVGYFLGWVLSGGFAFLTVAFLVSRNEQSLVFASIALLMAVVCFPPFETFLKQKYSFDLNWGARSLVILVGFMSIGMVARNVEPPRENRVAVIAETDRVPAEAEEFEMLAESEGGTLGQKHLLFFGIAMALFGLFIKVCFRILKDNERIVSIAVDRPTQLKGPGLVFVSLFERNVPISLSPETHEILLDGKPGQIEMRITDPVKVALLKEDYVGAIEEKAEKFLKVQDFEKGVIRPEVLSRFNRDIQYLGVTLISAHTEASNVITIDRTEQRLAA